MSIQSESSGLGGVGDYTFVRVLGRGGMGATYEARHASLAGRYVVQQRPLQMGARARERALRQIDAGRRLNHPSLVSTLEWIEDSECCYEVRAYFAGEDLESRVMREGPLSPSQLCSWLAEICEVLAYAHERDLGHGEISPANILVGEDSARLAEFAAQDPTERPRGLALHHAAPERLEGSTADPAGDVYGVGATLYHCATGLPPLTARNYSALAEAIRSGVPLLRSKRPELSEEFEALVARCMDLRPRERPSAHELRRALLGLAT